MLLLPMSFGVSSLVFIDGTAQVSLMADMGKHIFYEYFEMMFWPKLSKKKKSSKNKRNKKKEQTKSEPKSYVHIHGK